MSSDKIPGVPEGWELVRIGTVSQGEFFVGYDGQPEQYRQDVESSGWVTIIRKIEKPAAYRPFANAEEFKPHRDRWWRYNDSEDSEHVQPPAAYSKIGPMGSNWEQAFSGRVFDDGTPFGVRIDE
jgi:hypothetical protein